MPSWHHPNDHTDASFLAAVCVLLVILWYSPDLLGMAWAWLMTLRLPAGW